MRSGIVILMLMVFAVTLYAETTVPIEQTYTRSERYTLVKQAQQIADENGNAFEVSIEAIPKYKNCTGLQQFTPEDLKRIVKKLHNKSFKASLQKWDWRDNKGVTPVKNQGDCGSCWAFAATANFEHNIMCADKKEVDLAEQDLLNCNKQGYGCDGGNLDCSEYFRDQGCAEESAEPYKAVKESCKALSRTYKINDTAVFEEDAEMMKSCIFYYGSIVTVVDADSPAFKAYAKGVYNIKGGTPNHAILAVGWDDAAGYWIIKNSWGEEWGDKGYGKVAYGQACIGQLNAVTDYKGQVQ
ncbi:MAG: C1 family peptidase [Candidatus Wallbacteria bacterium]|nr:C1 family peptidase [Candidatus Wallbacteria bacterium]